MNPEEIQELKELVRKSAELTEVNNQVLRKMVFYTRVSLIWNIMKWVVIIGSALGVYYYFGEEVAKSFEFYRGVLSGNGSATNTQMIELFRSLRGQ